MPTLCIKSLSNGIPAAILFIPFYLSCSKFLLDFFLGKCYISRCPCSSVDRAPPSGGGCVSSILIRDVKRLWSFYGLTVFFIATNPIPTWIRSFASIRFAWISRTPIMIKKNPAYITAISGCFQLIYSFFKASSISVGKPPIT